MHQFPVLPNHNADLYYKKMVGMMPEPLTIERTREGELVDNLSAIHFKAVHTEIQGRFFSQGEADQLKEAIDIHTVTDPKVRAEAAKAWPEAE